MEAEIIRAMAGYCSSLYFQDDKTLCSVFYIESCEENTYNPDLDIKKAKRILSQCYNKRYIDVVLRNIWNKTKKIIEKLEVRLAIDHVVIALLKSENKRIEGVELIILENEIMGILTYDPSWDWDDLTFF